MPRPCHHDALYLPLGRKVQADRVPFKIRSLRAEKLEMCDRRSRILLPRFLVGTYLILFKEADDCMGFETMTGYCGTLLTRFNLTLLRVTLPKNDGDNFRSLMTFADDVCSI